jgi:hypothetical protein
MQFVSIVAYFVLTGFPVSVTNLTGTWALDRTRSDFGGAETPSHYALQIEQSGSYLAVTILSDESGGQRVTYRQCHTDGPITGLLLCVAPDGPDETWRISGDSLTITRSVRGKVSRLRQRLVLARCTELE